MTSATELAELPELRWCGHLPISRLPASINTAIDIGAFVGAAALTLAQRGATVWAFEPHPESFSTLLRNAASVKRVFCFQAAVTDLRSSSYPIRHLPGSPTATSFLYHDGYPILGDVAAVNVNKVLELPNGEIDYLKIDVEGMEHRLIPAISCENWARIRIADIELHSLDDTGYFRDLKSFPISQYLADLGFRLVPDTDGCVWAQKDYDVC